MQSSTRSGLRFGLYYDFRNPPQWQRPFTQLYGEIFDQIAWAEGHGFDNVWLSEHHLAEDGYAPAVLPTAAAIAARTKSIRIGTAVMDLPFHHPVRVAEDAAVVDVISNGRFELGVGVGYRVEEFESFAVPKAERGRRTSEALEIIRRLLDGETVTFKGRFFEVNNAKISPPSAQQPRLPIWAGGFTPAAAQRAAKWADGFIGVAGPSPELYGHYAAALQAEGKPTDNVRLAGGPFWLIPAADPDKAWREAAPHVLYQLNIYAEWLARSGMPILPHIRDEAHLRELGLFNVVDADSCITAIRAFASSVPLTHYYAFTLPPGLPPSWAQPHLELFASKVIPAFQ